MYMAKSISNPRVDIFFEKAKKWGDELKELRKIVLECGLTEELKWYQPCYTFEGNNLLIISGFKENCVISFFKGALLKDSKGILAKPGENTQSARIIKFTNVRDILKLKATLKAYIKETIENEKAGLKVTFKKITEHKVPEELQNMLDKDPAFKSAFKVLTPGRQRAYLMHFSAPKQTQTRISRIEKCKKQIMAGKGLNEN